MEIEPNNQIRHTVCKSWDDFTRIARADVALKSSSYDRGAFKSYTLFRGQADIDWPLHSKLERHLEHHNLPTDREHNARRDEYLDACENILLAFRTAARSIDPRFAEYSDQHLWQVGRHYGLITNLLDWSESPYVAAHFAFERWYSLHEYKQDWMFEFKDESLARIWGLCVFDNDLHREGEFEIYREMPLGAHRQLAQRGAFTRLCVPHPAGIHDYLLRRGLGHLLHAIDIPRKCFPEAANDLVLMNINPLTLFPDIEGAARHANIAYDAIREVRTIRAWTEELLTQVRPEKS